MTATSPISTREAFDVPASRKIEPNNSRNISGKTMIQKRVCRSRTKPLTCAMVSARKTVMTGTPGRSG